MTADVLPPKWTVSGSFTIPASDRSDSLPDDVIPAPRNQPLRPSTLPPRGSTGEAKAWRQLIQSAPRLLHDARAACEREGAEPSGDMLQYRIGQRLGLDGEAVARGLRRLSDARNTFLPSNEIPACAGGGSNRDAAAARLRALAAEVLGERERTIFLARSFGNGEPVPSLESLAERLGIRPARAQLLELSARRKIAIALMARKRSGHDDREAAGEPGDLLLFWPVARCGASAAR